MVSVWGIALKTPNVYVYNKTIYESVQSKGLENACCQVHVCHMAAVD